MALRMARLSTQHSTKSMRAGVYHAFGGPIAVEDVPRPVAPAGGVVLEVRATGVYRSDWHGWKGHDGDVIAHGLPFTPGHEVSGVVVERGAGVELPLGARVAAPFILSCGCCRECDRGRATICERQQQPGFTQPGSFAQYVALPRANRNLRVLPDNVSFESAAALGCRFTTAFRAVVQQGRLQAGETLAVFGCGGLGLSAVMCGVATGARVIAIDPSPAARARALELGASAAVDVSPTARARALELGASAAVDASEGCREAVWAATGYGADVCVECSGAAKAVEDAVYSARRGGRVVQAGLPLGDEKPEVPMARVAGWELEIFGSHGLASHDLPAILDLVSDGRLRPEATVERRVTLHEGCDAIMKMDHASPLGVTMVMDFA